MNGKLAKLAMGGFGIGAGGVVALAIFDVVRSQPEMTMKLLDAWGAPFVLMVAGMYLADRRMGQMIQTGKENAQALTSMAGAIDRIATKDDQREREQELLVNHLIAEIKDVKGGISAILERGKS